LIDLDGVIYLNEKDNKISGEGCEIIAPFNDKKPLEEIERSIIKTYRKQIWSKFIKAIKEYELIEDGDKIAVAISGGKDSLLMAKNYIDMENRTLNWNL
jgi:predicted PP-loop superfamily ATPase